MVGRSDGRTRGILIIIIFYDMYTQIKFPLDLTSTQILRLLKKTWSFCKESPRYLIGGKLSFSLTSFAFLRHEAASSEEHTLIVGFTHGL